MIQADPRWITPEEVAEYKIGSILSGGLGLATDNLGSVSFGKY